MTCRAAAPGFTLIEIAITLCIVALLTMLGLPSFATFLRNSEIRSTTESIANGLRVAQSEAVRRNTLVSFTLAGGASPGWTVKQVSDNKVVQTYSQQEGGVHVSVATQPVAANSVAFNRLGRVVPVAVDKPAIQQLTVSSTLAADARTLRVYVDGLHGVRMCDPSPLLPASDPRAC